MRNDYSKQAHKVGHDLEERFGNNDHKGGFLGSFILGIVLGAGAALLYAPKKGEEIQQDISEGWDNVKDKAGKWSDKAGDWAKDTADSVKGNVNDGIDKAKSAI